MNTQNRIMISAPSSASGKTTITSALLYGLKKQGKRVAALKCGPDYIDPLFHRRVLGIETGNIDLFMSDIEQVKDNLLHSCQQSDITVIEGAMGYFDGIGFSSQASAYDIANKTKTPVILIIDGKGMAMSILAILDGFLLNDREKNIRGVIVNNTTEKVWEFAKTEFNKRGIAPIGWVPRFEVDEFKSRHLGLITPDEIKNFDKIMHDIYEEVKDKIDWDMLFALACNAENISCSETTMVKDDLTIAIARDEAFCFYYEENIRMLKSYGCNIVYFSPLKDERLPDCDGLILWGGYPENYTKQLSANASMKESIRTRLRDNLPTIAECGGFMYLQKTIGGEAMVGLFEQDVVMEKKLRYFGYINMELKKGYTLFNKKSLKLKAHEFHYCHMADEGACFDIKKASGNGCWSGCITTDYMYAGFPHIFFPGNVEFLESFLEKCTQTRTNVRKPLQNTR